MASEFDSERWLSMQPPNLDEAGRAVAEVVREADSAFKVITKIRELSRKKAVGQRPVDINEIILQVLAFTSSELTSGGVTVQAEFACDLPVIQGAPEHLQQVMLELVMDGIDAMCSVVDRSRKLSIKSATNSLGVLVQVGDSGVGTQSCLPQLIFDYCLRPKPTVLVLGYRSVAQLSRLTEGSCGTRQKTLSEQSFNSPSPKVKESK